MRALLCVLLAAASLALDARPAGAQAAGRNEKVRISINVGAQLSSTTFSSTVTKPLFRETATISGEYTVPKGKLFDGGFVYRVRGNFGMGVAVSSYSESGNTAVTGSIPNPLGFNAPPFQARQLSGSTTTKRSETTLHIQAAYVIPSRKFDVAVFGGPSIFHVSHDLVADAVYTDVYPYDTVTFTSATIASATSTVTGFNAGVDVGYKVARGIAVGGLFRFSRASVSFPLTGSSSTVSADVGGAQVGGGVRFYF